MIQPTVSIRMQLLHQALAIIQKSSQQRHLAWSDRIHPPYPGATRLGEGAGGLAMVELVYVWGRDSQRTDPAHGHALGLSSRRAREHWRPRRPVARDFGIVFQSRSPVPRAGHCRIST